MQKYKSATSLLGLRLFVRVAEAGSFSEAGRQLGVAPSSVSRQINDLEQSLKAQLFQRTTRKLRLTEAGKSYFKEVSRILVDLDEAGLALTQFGEGASGILRINVPASLSRCHIVPIVVAYQKSYPLVEVVLRVTDKTVNLFEDNVDLAVRIGQLKDSSLIARKVGEAPRVVCASPAYLHDRGIPGSPGALSDHNCLIFRAHPGSNQWRFQDNKKRIISVQASGSMVADDGESLVAAAVAGHGVILVPGWLVGRELDSGDLQQILKEFHVVPGTTPLYAIYPQQKHLPLKVRTFIDFMTESFRAKDFS